MNDSNTFHVQASLKETLSAVSNTHPAVEVHTLQQI